MSMASSTDGASADDQPYGARFVHLGDLAGRRPGADTRAMSTTTHNPLNLSGVRSRPSRVIAAAGGLAAAIACGIALAAGGGSQDTAIAPASAGQGTPEVRQGSDAAILHHHWLNTTEPSAAERMTRQAERF